MNKFLFLFFFSSFYTFSQNKVEKYLFDLDTKEPLKAATINNSKNNTITNDDGHFIFYSENDSIVIRMMGYNELQTTFKELGRSQDTIYLRQSPIILDEIILQDYKRLVFKIYGNIQKNYAHTAHVDAFFLRCILKKNDSIILLEDVSGEIKRNSMFTSKEVTDLNFEFNLLNQRKIGVFSKNKMVEEIELNTLENLFTWFSTAFINPDEFEFIEEKMIDSNFTKVNYKPFQKYQNKAVGFYIINNNNKSIKEFFSKTNPLFADEIVFKEKFGLKWRTIGNELLIKYNKDNNTGKNFISSSKLKQRLELFNRKKEKIVYDIEYQLITTEPFANIQKFKSNVKNDKELFKLEVDFDPLFWENQNQLPLTKELNDFIRNTRNYDKDYKIISNF
jgi:hypothetical protein